MAVIIAVLFVLAFFVFLAMGIISHFEARGKKWFYFILSAFGLSGTILMFIFFNWNLEGRWAAATKSCTVKVPSKNESDYLVNKDTSRHKQGD